MLLWAHAEARKRTLCRRMCKHLRVEASYTVCMCKRMWPLQAALAPQVPL